MPSYRQIENDFTQFVTRLEVIDETGGAYVNTQIESIELHLQDDERTLKLFVKSSKPEAS